MRESNAVRTERAKRVKENREKVSGSDWKGATREPARFGASADGASEHGRSKLLCSHSLALAREPREGERERLDGATREPARGRTTREPPEGVTPAMRRRARDFSLRADYHG
ncbi:hypothetical protein GCM10009039_03540 [Halocalculus aciditolerans]|uniref:Uncharacterized protein n=1 Tax=Halocalculus aciditolerans TaxID=1383812 RepID=A0A830F7M0_9EURY|nr:hypothetical protein GCM10009039_03540 [Halocalculus aciditolerans]